MAPQAIASHSRRVRPRAVETGKGAGLREAEVGSVEGVGGHAGLGILTLAGRCIPELGPQETQVAPEAVDCSCDPGSGPRSQ